MVLGGMKEMWSHSRDMNNNVASPRERGREAMVRHRLSPGTRARRSPYRLELSVRRNPLSVTGSSKEAQTLGNPKPDQ